MATQTLASALVARALHDYVHTVRTSPWLFYRKVPLTLGNYRDLCLFYGDDGLVYGFRLDPSAESLVVEGESVAEVLRALVPWLEQEPSEMLENLILSGQAALADELLLRLESER